MPVSCAPVISCVHADYDMTDWQHSDVFLIAFWFRSYSPPPSTGRIHQSALNRRYQRLWPTWIYHHVHTVSQCSWPTHSVRTSRGCSVDQPGCVVLSL